MLHPRLSEVERGFFAGKGRELPRPVYRVPPEVAEAGAAPGARVHALGGSAIELSPRDTATR